MTFDGARFCGVLIVIFGSMSVLLNSFMIILFLSNGLVNWKHGSAAVYRLILSFLVTDVMQVTPTIYIGLCAVLQRSLLPIEFEIALGTLNLWMWHQMLLMLMIMAANRVIGVCYLHAHDKIFTARNVFATILSTWILTGAIAAVLQFYWPCCAMIPHFQLFTFFFYNPNNEEVYSKRYTPPLSEVCIVVLILSYAKVLMRLRKNAQEVASSLTQTAQRQRARQNIRFAIQFVLISLFFMLMYIFYKILPVIVPAGVLLPYSSIAFCMVANCSINSVMYLLLNPEISRLAKRILCCGKWVSTSESEVVTRPPQFRNVLPYQCDAQTAA